MTAGIAVKGCPPNVPIAADGKIFVRISRRQKKITIFFKRYSGIVKFQAASAPCAEKDLVPVIPLGTLYMILELAPAYARKIDG